MFWLVHRFSIEDRENHHMNRNLTSKKTFFYTWGLSFVTITLLSLGFHTAVASTGKSFVPTPWIWYMAGSPHSKLISWKSLVQFLWMSSLGPERTVIHWALWPVVVAVHYHEWEAQQKSQVITFKQFQQWKQALGIRIETL